MSTVRIQACAVAAIRPQQMKLGAVVQVDLELTPAQRFAAVAELLGTGIGEPEAYEAMRALFPDWFEDKPQPEVTESSFGEFMAVSAS